MGTFENLFVDGPDDDDDDDDIPGLATAGDEDDEESIDGPEEAMQGLFNRAAQSAQGGLAQAQASDPTGLLGNFSSALSDTVNRASDALLSIMPGFSGSQTSNAPPPNQTKVQLPQAIQAPLEQAGEAFGRGAAKSTNPVAQVKSMLDNVPPAAQIAAGVTIIGIAGYLLFGRKGR